MMTSRRLLAAFALATVSCGSLLTLDEDREGLPNGVDAAADASSLEGAHDAAEGDPPTEDAQADAEGGACGKATYTFDTSADTGWSHAVRTNGGSIDVDSQAKKSGIASVRMSVATTAGSAAFLERNLRAPCPLTLSAWLFVPDGPGNNVTSRVFIELAVNDGSTLEIALGDTALRFGLRGAPMAVESAPYARGSWLALTVQCATLASGSSCNLKVGTGGPLVISLPTPSAFITTVRLGLLPTDNGSSGRIHFDDVIIDG